MSDTTPTDTPEPDVTTSWPSVATISFPDGRQLRIVQDAPGSRPVYYLTRDSEAERVVEGAELEALLTEARQL